MGIEANRCHPRTVFPKRLRITYILCIVHQGEYIDFVFRTQSTHLMEGANLVAFVWRIRNAVAKIKNSHVFRESRIAP